MGICHTCFLVKFPKVQKSFFTERLWTATSGSSKSENILQNSYSEIAAIYKVEHVALHVYWTFSRPSVRLSVRPSVCPSLSFLKIGSLFFFDIVHDDS